MNQKPKTTYKIWQIGNQKIFAGTSENWGGSLVLPRIGTHGWNITNRIVYILLSFMCVLSCIWIHFALFQYEHFTHWQWTQPHRRVNLPLRIAIKIVFDNVYRWDLLVFNNPVSDFYSDYLHHIVFIFLYYILIQYMNITSIQLSGLVKISLSARYVFFRKFKGRIWLFFS